jgi:hypothetical protein
MKPDQWKQDHKKEGIEHNTSKIRRILKGKWNGKITYLEYVMNIDIKLISAEGTVLWLSSKDLKADTGREITIAQHQSLNPISCNQVWRQKQVAITANVEAFTAKWITLYQRVQYL